MQSAEISCELQILSDDHRQLVFEYESTGMAKFTHRILLKKNNYSEEIVDYFGSFSKNTTITQ